MTKPYSDPADELAAYALKFLPKPAPAGEETQPDPQVAAVYAQLATYYQQRATTNALTNYFAESLWRQGRWAEMERDNLSFQAEGVRFVLGNVERSIDQLARNQPRLFGERAADWWDRVKRRSMPKPPPPHRFAWETPATTEDAWPAMSMRIIDLMPGDEFERLIGKLLERAGWKVTRTGSGPDNRPGQGDHEVDLLGNKGEATVAVQCKRWNEKSSIKAENLRSFVGGARTMTEATALLFVTTTNRISSQAQAFVEKAEVVLITRDDVESWCQTGVAPAAVVALAPADEAGEETAEPTPPPAPILRGLRGLTLFLLVLVIAGMWAGPLYVAPNEQTAFYLSLLVTPLVMLGPLWIRERWKVYWWRRGVNELWGERGWFAPRLHLEPHRYSTNASQP